jgi:hypothetical protein
MRPAKCWPRSGTPRPPVRRLAATRRGHRAPGAGPHRRRRPGPCHRRLAGWPAATRSTVTDAPPMAEGGRSRWQDPARQRPPPTPTGPPAGGDGPLHPRRPGPDRRGRHHQRDHRVPAAAGGLGPDWAGGHCRRHAYPARPRRVAGRPETRRLRPDRQGQSAHPAPPAATPALARGPRRRPHPRPRPRPRGGPPFAGHHRRWPRLSPTPPRRSASPVGSVPAQPAVARRDGGRGHQPHCRPGPPCPPGRLDPGSPGHRGVAPHPRCHLRRGRQPGPHRHRPQPGPWPACATSPSASCGSTAATTSLPRCAATPATPPGSCPCWASQPDRPALAETPNRDAGLPRPVGHRIGPVAPSTNRAIVVPHEGAVSFSAGPVDFAAPRLSYRRPSRQGGKPCSTCC